MKFTKVIGTGDSTIIAESEERLSSAFVELAMGYNERLLGSHLGGDVFIYNLITPLKHICDMRAYDFDLKIAHVQSDFDAGNITEAERDLLLAELHMIYGEHLLRTASTNGLQYHWYPPFINKQSKIGLRLIIGHEAWHSIYMHPSRRGSRNRGLWNLSVDFKVNYTQMQDLRNRGFYYPDEIFAQELGDFITLGEYVAFLRDPFNPPMKLAKWNPIWTLQQELAGKTPDQSQTLYYADPRLAPEFRKPENIYSYIMSCIPKCSTCGKVGVWKKPEELKKLEAQLAEKQNRTVDDHQH